jgi:hypothetical protein
MIVEATEGSGHGDVEGTIQTLKKIKGNQEESLSY